MGVSKYLKEKNNNIKCFVVEPEGCRPIKGLPITKPLHLLQVGKFQKKDFSLHSRTFLATLQGSGYGAVPAHMSNGKTDGLMDDAVVSNFFGRMFRRQTRRLVVKTDSSEQSA